MDNATVERKTIKATRITFSSGAKVGGGIYSIGARWGHASISTQGKRILVFGGQGESLYSNTSIYDPVTSVWSEVNTVDKGPSGRYGHTATLIDDVNDQRVMIFGGKSGKKYLNDLFSLNLRTMSWSTFHFEKSTLPDSRAGHTSTFVPSININGPHRMVVFGGSHSDKYLNSCFILDLPKSQTGTIKWTKPQIKGKAPSQRCGHSADFLKDRNSILIFGGFDGRKSFNDLHLLNMTDMSWSAVKTNGTTPTTRNGHTSVLVGGRYLVFYGGCSENNVSNDIQILDTDSFTWLAQPIITGLTLFPRFNHSSNLLDSGEMIVFGGCASGVLYSDMCSLDLKLFLPTPSTPTRPLPIQSSIQQQQQQQPTTTTTTTTTTNSNLNINSPPTPQYSIDHLSQQSQTTTPTPLSPMTTSSCSSCQHHNYPHNINPTSTSLPTTPTSIHVNNVSSSLVNTNLLSIQLSNALSLLNSEQNQKTSLSDELMKTKNERAEAFRNALEEQSKIETLEKELNKIENAYKKELSQKNKVQDSLLKISSTLKEKETIIQSYQEIMGQLKYSLKDSSMMDKKDSAIVQLLYQFSNITNNSGGSNGGGGVNNNNNNSGISINPTESILLAKENIVNKSLEIQLEELKKENQKLKDNATNNQMKLLEYDLIKQTITNRIQRETVSVDNLLGDKLDSLEMKDLDKLEELYHNGLKKVGGAKQDLLQKQLLKMQREKDESASNGNGKTCVVCVDLLINAVLVPCRHSCICSTCAKKLSLCPLCRTPINDVIEYY
ncbi:hypothetical protein ACTA71_009485 [Dictyostelium dimigraforme]